MGRKIEPGDLILSPLAKPFPRKKEAWHCATTSLHSTTYLGTQTRKPRLHLTIATTRKAQRDAGYRKQKPNNKAEPAQWHRKWAPHLHGTWRNASLRRGEKNPLARLISLSFRSLDVCLVWSGLVWSRLGSCAHPPALFQSLYTRRSLVRPQTIRVSFVVLTWHKKATKN
jgi:hypothetical protein